MRHPSEQSLALLAGGDLSLPQRLWVARHTRKCNACAMVVREFETLRTELNRDELPCAGWADLELEMRANIRLGLEAGACVAQPVVRKSSSPRLAVAFASLLILAVSGLLMPMHQKLQQRELAASAQAEIAPVLAATRAGLELRNGASSVTFLNRHGEAAERMVGAQGEIRARFVDGETGSVTITNVYMGN